MNHKLEHSLACVGEYNFNIDAGTTFTVPVSTGTTQPTAAVVDTTCYPISF